MTVGERIKSRRLNLGMTLEEVANFAGVTRQTIQKYENNIISNIPSDKIENLSRALGVSPSFLMGWDEDNKEKEPSFDGSLSEDEIELIKSMRTLSAEDAKNILTLVQGIAKK